MDFIPNELYEIYQKYNKQDVSYILSHYNSEEQEIVQEYIDFLIKNEYAILGTEHDAEYNEKIYNPYIAKWKDEEGYMPVEESLKKLQITQ